MYIESIVKTLISCVAILAVILIYRISVHQLVKTTAEKLWFAIGLFIVLSMANLFFLQSSPATNNDFRYFTLLTFELLWWLSLYYLINQMIQHWFWENLYIKQGITYSRVFHDLISIFLFILVLIAIIHFVFNKSVYGLFAASGVLVIVVAYSAQVYLSDVFAGFELQSSKEFVVGDWIKFNDQVGKVVQINWQYVKLMTRENNQLSIANSIISKAVITNLSKPTPERAVSMTIPLFDNTPPASFKQCLIQAALQSPHVLKSPAPVASLLDLQKDNANYRLTYYTQEIDESLVNNNILSALWYIARRKQIKITPKELTSIALPEMKAIEAFLKKTDLFQNLSQEEIQHLATHAISHEYGPPERLLEQGQSNSSLFLIYSGAVDVYLTDEIPSVYVATITSGDYVGEMSFLTGEICSASVYIKEESIILEITHDNIAELFAKKPSLVKKISEVMMTRKTQDTELHIEAAKIKPAESHHLIDRLMEQIKLFFHLT